MVLFKKNGKTFESVKPQDFPNFEESLEDWIEDNPHILTNASNDERILIIQRQPKTDLGRYPDLIGIDKNGNVVIIELKKGKTPRDVIAQALEYAEWGRGLTEEKLNEEAMRYFSRKGFDYESLRDACEKILQISIQKFNTNQRIRIVAQEISDDIKGVANFLKTKGVDIECIEFTYHKSSEDEYLETDVITKEEMGKEAASSSQGSKLSREELFEALEKGTPGSSKIAERFLDDAKHIGLGCSWGANSVNLYLPNPLFSGRIFSFWSIRPDGELVSDCLPVQISDTKLPDQLYTDYYGSLKKFFPNAKPGCSYKKLGTVGLKISIDELKDKGTYTEFLSALKECVETLKRELQTSKAIDA